VLGKSHDIVPSMHLLVLYYSLNRRIYVLKLCFVLFYFVYVLLKEGNICVLDIYIYIYIYVNINMCVLIYNDYVFTVYLLVDTWRASRTPSSYLKNSMM